MRINEVVSGIVLLAAVVLVGAPLACNSAPDVFPHVERIGRPVVVSEEPIQSGDCPEEIRLKNTTGSPRIVHYTVDGVITSEEQADETTWLWAEECRQLHSWECKGFRIPTSITVCQGGACVEVHDCDPGVQQ